MANANLENKRLSGYMHLAELDKREEYENMVRKQMIEERKKKKGVILLEPGSMPESITKT